MAYQNSFGVVRDLEFRGGSARYYSLPALQQSGFPGVARLPYSLKILLENLLRHEDGAAVRTGDIQALANWDHSADIEKEIAFTPAAVAAETVRYFEDPAYAARTREALADVRVRLGKGGASRRAAEQVLAVCEARSRGAG